jgi:hypothetical protein
MSPEVQEEVTMAFAFGSTPLPLESLRKFEIPKLKEAPPLGADAFDLDCGRGLVRLRFVPLILGDFDPLFPKFTFAGGTDVGLLLLDLELFKFGILRVEFGVRL